MAGGQGTASLTCSTCRVQTHPRDSCDDTCRRGPLLEKLGGPDTATDVLLAQHATLGS